MMDPMEYSLDNLFSKQHPSFPVETKICIIGGGPSGLSAAYALCRLGYFNVTLIEKQPFVGGMCESVDIQGRIYDLGGQVLAANSAPTIFHMAKEIEAETEDMDTHKFALITGEYSINDLKVVQDYVSVIPITLKLQDEAKVSGREGVHGVANIASDLTPAFLRDNGIKSIPKSLAYGYAASGYGFVQDMPYAYVHEFTRTSIAGKIKRFKGGYMSFWHKLSQGLPIQLRCNTEVTSIRRHSKGITVSVKDEDHSSIKDMEFDKIIISGSFPFRNGRTYRSSLTNNTTEMACELMDKSFLEEELFRKVKTIDYYTTVLKIKGLEHIRKGFYYFEEFTNNPAAIGNPVAMQRFYEDTNTFLFWSYGNSNDIKGPNIIELAINAAKSLGGHVQDVVLQRRFKYFPHVTSQDMKDGFYDKLEIELQGQQNTYYVGGLMAFELTERNASYAMGLVRKHFANDSPVPNFHYIKSLMTIQPNGGVLRTKQLDEAKGIEFPDLSSIDSYLNHWGTHALTQNKVLYTWVNDKGEKTGQRTYKELHAYASLIANKLLTNTKPAIKRGDRVLMVYLPGLDFIEAFFGCLRAGVTPVPVIPPDPSQRGGQALLHIANIAKSCGPVAILSTYSFHMYVRACSAKNLLSMKGKSEWPDIPWLHTDSWLKKTKITPHSNANVEPKASDLCFLQFTSGSTGEAKGVMITQGGIVQNVKLMRRRYNSTSNTVLVSWLPQYHDMGLIGGIITSMVSGGSAILFSPTTFIKDPLLWLRVMSTHSATHSAGPNFAFELIVRRLESIKVHDFDLSSMVFLMVAAEPVRSNSLKRFIELTKPFGLTQEVMAPGYGLAENCVYVSSAFGENKPILIDREGRVCCGYVQQGDVDVDIKIVDLETGKEEENPEIEGEIWISSLSAGIGYWGKEELSEATFRNELLNHPGKTFLRTGDLGRIIQGKLFITGRIKDLIIVGGRNIYCTDVEKTVESSSEVLRPGCCAVVAIQKEKLLAKGISTSETYDQVGLVVIAEVRETKFIVEDVIKKIETRVAEEHGVIVASVVFVKARSISKTTSGKIKRYECAKNFINGTLNVINHTARSERKSNSSKRNFTKPQETRNGSKYTSKADIVNFLKELLHEQTGISKDDISTSESLVSYGVDSIGVVRAAQKLSDFLGVPVGAIDIFTATCIEDLSNFAEGLLAKSRPRSMVECPSSIDTQVDVDHDVTPFQKVTIWMAQIMALAYISFLLILPAYASVSLYTNVTTTAHEFLGHSLWAKILISLACAPLCWISCIFLTCICLAFLGNSFLQPNHIMNMSISIWSVDFVKWWALYKVQDVASKYLAVHLRGTMFINYWFRILGAKIALSALLDATEITDPSLVSVGEDAVIAEGALLQSHEVKNGILRFSPIKIGRRSSVGPYAVIQKGSIIEEGDEVLGLNTCVGSKNNNINARTEDTQKGKMTQKVISKRFENKTLTQFIGIYMVGFLSSLSAGITYLLYTWIMEEGHSLKHFGFFCVSGAFHWLPYTLVAYATIFDTVPSSPVNFAYLIAMSYIGHGIILSYFTCIMNILLSEKDEMAKTHLKAWFLHRINASCHLKFAKLLSGTETFAMYLRSMGAKIGRNCSIRSINPVLDPQQLSIGDGVHLGDFSHITPGYYGPQGYTCKKIEIQDNSVLGSQSLVLPGSVIEKDVILGAISVAPQDSLLRRGGVYVGSKGPVMVKNGTYLMDDRLEEMDMKYKKVLGNLAANLASTTMKVNSRYFHRIGAAGKGIFKIYDDIPSLPCHKIFSPGMSYPVIIRHSNCLSSDDDARLDPRGAAIRILSNETDEKASSPLLDLTLKTGNAFHARSIGDFASWLVCGVAAREEHVKYAPHIRDAMWNSIRNTNSYAELHYYSNFTRLFRFDNEEEEMYVRFKLRPFDKKIGEDAGKVEPQGILPPETGALPRDENDNRPLKFLADDFQNRVNSPDKIHYVVQLQIRKVPQDENTKEIALDVTKPWDDKEFPYIEVGEILIDQLLTEEESEKLEFHPFYRCHEVDVIRATSCNQSASIDHGRSIIYEICQHLRNRKPLPEAWRLFLDQSDVKMDFTGCPMAAKAKSESKETSKVTLARAWYITLWLMTGQPLLQTFLPYFLMGLVIFMPFHILFYVEEASVRIWYFPLFWMSSGLLAGVLCSAAKWILIGKKEEGETEQIWSRPIFMDTTWQAVRTLVGEYFMEMTTGSFLFGIWMKTLGSEIAWNEAVYVDSMGALLNPEMVKIEENGSVERDALFFGHIYEGEGGRVKYGKITVRNGGFVGSRAIAMPGATVETGGNLTALSLAMKGEVVM